MNAKLLVPVAFLVLGIASARPAAATTLTFEDLPDFTPVPANYGGIATWTNFWSLDVNNWPTYLNSPVSGHKILFNAFSLQTVLANPTPFTINDLYIAASNTASNNDFVFNGYNGATLVDTQAVTIGRTPTEVTFNWSGLTSFTIDSYVHGTTNIAYFGLDNLTLNQDLPEPVSIAVLGMGLAGLLGARRSRTRRVIA